MPAKALDKAIITNAAVLEGKYGKSGKIAVLKAVAALVKADLGRNIRSQLVDLSDQATMAHYGVPAISADQCQDEELNKQAIDAVFKGNDPAPQYLLLLGSTDVIPHVQLDNPMPGDGDATVASDLPYACAKKFSREPRDFLRPTRVVGRLPNVVSDSSPAYLLALLKQAATYKQRLAAEFSISNCLAITAQVWKKSTALSLDAIFGSGQGLKVSPPDSYKWTPTELGRLVHFINCHGAPADSRFYGQKGNAFPTAHDADWIKKKIKPGCILAAECCYGAELFDPALTGGNVGIANTYLGAGASGCFGSSTIAYGPAEANDLADLMCQYFVLEIIDGASLGLACLKARLKYLQKKAGALTPTDLKTLSQFHLMGDPSLTPVTMPAKTRALAINPSKAMFEVARHDRVNRRLSLVALAEAMPIFTLAAPTRAALPKGALMSKLNKLAADVGIHVADAVRISYPVEAAVDSLRSGGLLAVAKSALTGPSAVHSIFERKKSPARLPQVPLVRGIDAVQYGEGLQVRAFESR